MKKTLKAAALLICFALTLAANCLSYGVGLLVF